MMKRRWIGWLVGSLVGLATAGAVERAEAYTIDVAQSRLTASATARVGNDSDVDEETGSVIAVSLALALGDTAAERYATSVSHSANYTVLVEGIETERKIRTDTRLTARDFPGRPGPAEKATAGASGLITFTTHKNHPGEIDDILLELATEALGDTYSYTVTDVTSGEVLFDSVSSGFGSVVLLPAKVGDWIRVHYSGYVEASGGSISRSLTSSVGVVGVRNVVPEPGTGVLIGLGLATLGWTRRRFEPRE